jgi:hypothetical protein
MKPVARHEIVDYVTYTERRPEIRTRVLETKSLRRYHVGGVLTFLFENRDTVRYQVQEMMRVEQIVKEVDILHELTTYNALIPGDGQLVCTMLVEIDDEERRKLKLPQWLDLNPTLFLETPDGTRVRPTWDPAQMGSTRISSVQYLTFDLGGTTPAAIGCDHGDEALAGRYEFSESERAALAVDLS